MRIDKQKVYEIGDYTFTNYICLPDNQIRQILEWRNHEDVRRWMLHSNIISYEAHIKYVQSLRTREDVCYWLVSHRGMPIGAVYLTNICDETDSAELGYYMRPDYINSGEGFDFVYNMFAFALDMIQVGHLNGTVRTDNKIPYSLSAFFGSKILGVKEARNNDQEGLKFYECYITPEMFHENGNSKKVLVKFLKYLKSDK